MRVFKTDRCFWASILNTLSAVDCATPMHAWKGMWKGTRGKDQCRCTALTIEVCMSKVKIPQSLGGMRYMNVTKIEKAYKHIVVLS